MKTKGPLLTTEMGFHVGFGGAGSKTQDKIAGFCDAIRAMLKEESPPYLDDLRGVHFSAIPTPKENSSWVYICVYTSGKRSLNDDDLIGIRELVDFVVDELRK